jgi:hypothetical protein
MKRIAAMSMVLIATVILVAHAVIPHHHHDQRVHLESGHAPDQADLPLQESPGTHHHHGVGGTTDCLLEISVRLPSNSCRAFATGKIAEGQSLSPVATLEPAYLAYHPPGTVCRSDIPESALFHSPVYHSGNPHRGPPLM